MMNKSNKKYWGMSLGLLVPMVAAIVFFNCSGPKNTEQTLMKGNTPNAGQWKQVEIGFNVGYFSAFKDLKSFKTPFETIRQDGFVHLRAIDPWRKDKVSYKKVADVLETITDQGFHFLLGLSNYPYAANKARVKPFVEKMAAHPEYQKYKGKTKEELEKQVTNKTSWTNRFPPEDMGNYKKYLTRFCEELDKRGVMEKMSFEIGNEPNALFYYWGSVKEFTEILRLSYDVLKDYNSEVMCCGFVARQIRSGEHNPKSRFYQFTYNEPLFENKVLLSYHLYMGKSDNDWVGFDTIQHNRLANSVITETNAFVNMTNSSQKLAKNNSPYFVYKMAQLLAFAYKNDVKRIYFHKLKDQPEQHKRGRNGFFDIEGNPKPSYDFLVKINNLIKDGYKVNSTAKYIEIIGKNQSCKVALEKTDFAVPKNKVEEFSREDENKYKDKLEPSDWVIYDN